MEETAAQGWCSPSFGSVGGYGSRIGGIRRLPAMTPRQEARVLSEEALPPPN
jgi:hypothetical protein